MKKMLDKPKKLSLEIKLSEWTRLFPKNMTFLRDNNPT